MPNKLKNELVEAFTSLPHTHTHTLQFNVDTHTHTHTRYALLYIQFLSGDYSSLCSNVEKRMLYIMYWITWKVYGFFRSWVFIFLFLFLLFCWYVFVLVVVFIITSLHYGESLVLWVFASFPLAVIVWLLARNAGCLAIGIDIASSKRIERERECMHKQESEYASERASERESSSA